MFSPATIKALADSILFGCCLFLLIGSIFLSVKTRFIQFRLLPKLLKELFSLFRKNRETETDHTVLPHKALFTAMSTTLGISTIVAPVIAIHIGGPGALIGFLLTSFLGSAATYVEVSLSIEHRKILDSGEVMGGPMQYMKKLLSPRLAKWYAICCMVLMTAWSGAQANQLTAILNSPLLGLYRIPIMASAGIITLFVLFLLFGGIKRIGSLSATLVPIMFLLYVGSCLWIILCNIDQWGALAQQILRSAVSPYAMASGTLIGGLVSTLRWGIFKGIQASEAGLGTQAIPHSMAATSNPHAQATLAMVSTYTAGIVAFLSGCVALLTKTWENPSLPLGMSMVAASFEAYFSLFGVVLVTCSTLLFGFGTILGNSFNGSQCYRYLTNNKRVKLYFLATAGMIFFGALSDVKTFWSLIDIVLACTALPHMFTLLHYVFRKKESTLTLISATEGLESERN